MAKSKLDALLGRRVKGYEIHQYWSEGDGVQMQLRLIFANKIVALENIIDSLTIDPGSFILKVENVTYSIAHKQNKDGVPDEKVTFTGGPYYFNGVEQRRGACIVTISDKKN